MKRTLILLSWLTISLAAIHVADGSEVRTIAGNGTDGYAGDGGAADAAAVSQPFGVVIGPDKAVYIC